MLGSVGSGVGGISAPTELEAGRPGCGHPHKAPALRSGARWLNSPLPVEP